MPWSDLKQNAVLIMRLVFALKIRIEA